MRVAALFVILIAGLAACSKHTAPPPESKVPVVGLPNSDAGACNGQCDRAIYFLDGCELGEHNVFYPANLDARVP